MSEELQQSLGAELATHLARTIEAMTSEEPRLTLGREAPSHDAPSTFWQQKFTATRGAAWLVAAASSWTSVGARTLRAAGIEESDAEMARNTFSEVLAQAFSMLARSISGRAKTEWHCAEGSEVPEPPPAPENWTSVHLAFSDGATDSFYVTFDKAVLSDLAAVPAPEQAILQKTPAAPAPVRENSKTLDLLLDVELPVSVSFGRAQLPLKDVIKLTTGCIVQLNRTISEPVEVIVNNCVIARGEVVVVEGNFGVRIQQVVSREERLRTLY